MARSSHHIQGSPLRTRNRIHAGRLLFAAVWLLLPLLGAGRITPVHAAPRADTRVSYGISVSKAANPICAGQDYVVTVVITKVTEVLTGTEWKRYIAPQLSGVSVEGSVRDAGIGTLNPAEVMTGWDLDAPGTVVFTLHANKAGSTQLFFETSIAGKYLDAKEPITVVNCKYKVTVISNMAANYPNLSVLAVGVAEGEMKADQSGNLNGAASVEWNVYAFSKCFTHNTQVSVSPDATLKGSLSQDGSSLAVHADFQPVSVSNTSTATCYVSGGSSSTSTFTPPSLDITVPATGGGTAKPLSVTWGEVHLQGSAVINVTPIESK